MLSIGKMGAGSADYYAGLAREDYYQSGGEPPGVWLGRGAQKLGLTGPIDREHFHNLFAGFSADGKIKLVRNAGAGPVIATNPKTGKNEIRERQAGWDLTFSADKTVSVLWSQETPEMRAAIQRAHFTAVEKAVGWLEDTAGFTRTGKGGAVLERARLVVATFEHGTSRAQDPQLHTHALVMNIGVGAKATTTLHSLEIFKSKMAAGALYRAELAKQLEIIGYQVERAGKGTFRISEVPEKLCEFFSKRREEIEKVIAEKGWEGAKAAAMIALSTRQVKEHIARRELFSLWQESGKRFEFLPERAREQAAEHRKDADVVPEQAQKILAVKFATGKLMEHQSHFTKREFLRATAEQAPGRSLGVDEVCSAADDWLYLSKDIVRLGFLDGQERFTTRENLALESRMLSAVEQSKASAHHVASDTTVEAVIVGLRDRMRVEGRELSGEQKEAIRSVTKSEGSVRAVIGGAGTGKTTMLEGAREAWEKDGFTVLGCASAGRAADGLQVSAGIKSYTIAKLLMDLSADSRSRPRGVRPGYDGGLSGLPSPGILAMMATAPDHPADVHTGHGFVDERAGHAPATVADDAEKQKMLRNIQRSKKFDPEQKARLMDSIKNPAKLTSKTILVVDEAGMVGTKEMSRLVEACAKSGAKLVLVGDAKQLQPVSAGGPFKAIAESTDASELKKIVRQKTEEARQSVADFSEGKAAEALAAHAARGELHISEGKAGVMRNLVSVWAEKGGLRDPESNLMIAATNAEVSILNGLAREAGREAGHPGTERITFKGTELYAGDRVVFTRNSTLYGVRNGNLGELVRIDRVARTLHIRLDESNKTAVIPMDDYKGEVLAAYAVTTHKAQGMTVQNSFVMVGGDRHQSYVQGSRHRGECHLFADRQDAGDAVSEIARSELAKQMSRKNQKDLAHDILAQTSERKRDENCGPVRRQIQEL